MTYLCAICHGTINDEQSIEMVTANNKYYHKQCSDAIKTKLFDADDIPTTKVIELICGYCCNDIESNSRTYYFENVLYHELCSRNGYGPQEHIPLVTYKPNLERLNSLRKRRAVMRDYLQVKFDEEDYHGVQDVASDLRDIDVEIATLEKVAKNG